MRLTKIYTKTGDSGSTMLADGSLVPKDNLRLEAYGTVDELNAHIGALRDIVQELPVESRNEWDPALFRIQNELFDIGGELATPKESISPRQGLINTKDIIRLEEEIDRWNEKLPGLKNFVLPGGHRANSQAHVCRTVCRRAERVLVQLIHQDNSIRQDTQVYLNRLSDWLFVCSRSMSLALNCPEVLWDQRRREKES